MELSEAELGKLKVDTLAQLASVKGVQSPRRKDDLVRALVATMKRPREEDSPESKRPLKRARTAGSPSPVVELDDDSDPATTPKKRNGASRLVPFLSPFERTPSFGPSTPTGLRAVRTPSGPSLTPARSFVASVVNGGFDTAVRALPFTRPFGGDMPPSSLSDLVRAHDARQRGLLGLTRAVQSSPLLQLPLVLVAQILNCLKFREKVGLWRVQALQSTLLARTAWEPVVIDRQESYHFCMNFYNRQSISQNQRAILRTLQECTALRMHLWDRPPYERPLTDDEPSDRDEPAESEAKKKRRAKREQNNSANFAHAALLFHILRFRALKSLQLTNVHSEYGPRLVKDVRKGFKHLGYFRVFWDEPSQAYEVVAEDRCPEPLDPAALLKENVARHARVLAALRARGDAHREVRRLRDLQAAHRPEEDALSLKEALFLQEFTVVIKGTEMTLDMKARVVFTFAYGSALRSVRKGEARELYGDVLQQLMSTYPAWAASIPAQESAPVRAIADSQ